MTSAGEAIRSAREARGLTRQRLAEMSGLGMATLARAELHPDHRMYPNNMLSVAKALHQVSHLTEHELEQFASLGVVRKSVLVGHLARARASRAEASHPRARLFELADDLADAYGLDEAELILARLVTAGQQIAHAAEVRIRREWQRAEAAAADPSTARPPGSMLVHQQPIEIEGMTGTIYTGYFVPDEGQGEPQGKKPKARRKSDAG